MRDIAVCVPAIATAKVTDFSVVRAREAVTHFAPGCYDSFLKPRTSFPNMFAAGDWIDDRHGSFSQEKVGVHNVKCHNMTPIGRALSDMPREAILAIEGQRDKTLDSSCLGQSDLKPPGRRLCVKCGSGEKGGGGGGRGHVHQRHKRIAGAFE